MCAQYSGAPSLPSPFYNPMGRQTTKSKKGEAQHRLFTCPSNSMDHLTFRTRGDQPPQHCPSQLKNNSKQNNCWSARDSNPRPPIPRPTSSVLKTIHL